MKTATEAVTYILDLYFRVPVSCYLVVPSVERTEDTRTVYEIMCSLRRFYMLVLMCFKSTIIFYKITFLIIIIIIIVNTYELL